MLINMIIKFCPLVNFDVVIQLFTASFFALTGLNFFENKFKSSKSDFQKLSHEISEYSVITSIKNESNIHLRSKLMNFKCYYNIIIHLYPNRFNEIFYKGGILGLFILIFIGLLRSNSDLNIFRIMPAITYSFISTFFLSRRLFCKISYGQIIADMADKSDDLNEDEIIYPFKNSKKESNIKSNYFIRMWINFKIKINPKYMKPKEGRNVFHRCILHLLILVFLTHLNWFFINYTDIGNNILDSLHYFFCDHFINDIKIFKKDNLKFFSILLVIITFFLPYIVLIIFYARNINIHRNIEEESKNALGTLNIMKDASAKEVFETKSILKQIVDKYNLSINEKKSSK